jgi:hypothetical protein
MDPSLATFDVIKAEETTWLSTLELDKGVSK